MRIRGLTLVCMIAASICSTASAAELNPLEPSVYWRMEFGTPRQAPMLGYGFALRYGHNDTARAIPALVQFDVFQTAAVARLAGIPLSPLAFGLAQNGDEALVPDLEAEQEARTPWYARQWVWWTGAGLAATGAILSGLGEGEHNASFNNQTDGGGGSGLLCGGNIGPYELPDDCVVPIGFTSNPSVLAATAFSEVDLHWMSGIGHMGDLTKR